MLRSWLALALGVGLVAVILASSYAWSDRPETYRDAVIQTLDGRGVAYTGLEIYEVCRPDPNCIADLRTFPTVVYRDTASYGQVTCYDRGGDCYLDIASLGIWRAQLPDLRGVRLLPKPLVRLTEHILAYARALVRRAQS
jgi:hypothetical protein